MTIRRSLLRRLKLRYVLFIALLLSGIIPLAISSLVLITQSEGVLESSERESLLLQAGTLSREVNMALVASRRQLQQLGAGLLAAPGTEAVAERLRAPWVESYLRQVQHDNPDLSTLRLLDPISETGPVFGPRNLESAAAEALKQVFAEARSGRSPAYRFVGGALGRQPLAALAVRATDGLGRHVVAEALVPLKSVERAQREEGSLVDVFLIDPKGELLRSGGSAQSRLPTDIVRQFAAHPMSMTQEYVLQGAGGKRRQMLLQFSAVDESGGGVVVQKPLAAAFASVDQMFWNALFATALLVVLAFVVAYFAARQVSQPIQRLIETTHEIAAGNYSRRIAVEGLGFELGELADDFNRMSLHLESHVQQLRQAAQTNRELFVGSLRAFVAAVDAKDPYTRGHSERVAAVSRTIARQLALPEEMQNKVWMGALLHDVGKIGIEDQILRKSGVLTPEEYEQMKLHTVMGADILSRIEQLKEVVPAVRWHHESWNGRGYPDGLRGEQIPLPARIVAVADCFDAITTNRPYQQAYSLQFAVETITKLTGSRFDAKVVTAFLRAFEAGEVRRPARAEPVPAAAAS